MAAQAGAGGGTTAAQTAENLHCRRAVRVQKWPGARARLPDPGDVTLLSSSSPLVLIVAAACSGCRILVITSSSHAARLTSNHQ